MTMPAMSRRYFLQRALASGVSAGFANLATLRNCLAQSGDRAASGASAAVRRRMDEGQPSATAQGTAMQRAAHQVFDDPIILEDPVALPIIGAENEALLRSNPDWYQTPSSLGVRAFVVMRSRYAEDALADATRRGVRQYVVLGAGLDTFAYRNPYAARVNVLEVDHPSTQAWKRNRLREGRIGIPSSLTFAPVDFEKQTLADGLERAGFRRSAAAVFSWLGVVVYLTRAAVMQTLQFVASSAAPRSEIVFDLLLPHSFLSEQQKRSREATMRRVAALGEPWLSFFDPWRLAEELGKMGYAHVEILGPEQANRRYFADRNDDLYVRGTNHLIRARV